MKRTMQDRQSNWIKRSLFLKEMFDHIDTPTMKWAEDLDELEQAFSLVHEEYLKLGYIKQPKSSKMFFNIHNLLPESGTSVIKCGSKVVATMGIIMDDKHFGLAMDAVYHKELNQLRSQGHKLCEFGALATSREFRRNNLFMYLFRSIYWDAVNRGVNKICIMVNPKHVPFYKTVLLFENLGPERDYHRLEAPAVGLQIDIDTYIDKLRAYYRNFEPEFNLYGFVYNGRSAFLKNQGSMLGKKEHRSIDGHIAQYFFTKEKNILKKLSPVQKDYMLKIH